MSKSTLEYELCQKVDMVHLKTISLNCLSMFSITSARDKQSDVRGEWLSKN